MMEASNAISSKVQVEARRKMRQELEEQYAHKMCHLADQRKSYRSYA
jgi:hypothetical protein